MKVDWEYIQRTEYQQVRLCRDDLDSLFRSVKEDFIQTGQPYDYIELESKRIIETHWTRTINSCSILKFFLIIVNIDTRIKTDTSGQS